ncbi:MAG: hypothetical protein EB056_07235 [Verrucomicrobia bacterium]|nr:hypothetical protein [Verrucomicrobiota bacterium]
MFLEVSKSPVQVDGQFLFPCSTHHPAPGTVAAVGGTTVGDQKQDPVWIAMDQPWNWHMGILAAGIQHLVGSDIRLLDSWHHLAADWALRIVTID